ncbi:MAG: Uma2 family endonuclease [Desulfamplus sp.]|nr:Uma2 family endonuclease [Desulfamplus sp.]
MNFNVPTTPNIKPDHLYTYADYLSWQDNKRYELYNGIVHEMLPAPSRKHQDISANLIFEFKRFTQKTSCKVYHAPFDVRLPATETALEDENVYTVVQPDIVVVCDPKKLDEKGCIGPPDLVVEILSPSNSRNDIEDKFALYEYSGVSEYWIIHPEEETLIVYRLDKDGKYIFQQLYSNMAKVNVGIFQDVIIDLSHIFNQ